jgi:hypothetical protein
MVSQHINAMKLALEFVEANHSGGPDAFELITVIKQALAAPVPSDSGLTNRYTETQPSPVQELEEQLKDALESLDFYRRRVEALQQWQSKMRDPERTIVCDILANGQTLEPAGDRYFTPPAAQQEPVFCEHCGGNDEDPQDHCMDCTRPRWEPVTPKLLAAQHPWLYEQMWIALKDGSVVTGHYEWMQGRKPDRFWIAERAHVWAFEATHVMPMIKPQAPTIATIPTVA